MHNDLATLPSHRSVFIDANIFIYHFTQSPLTAACTAFLQRVEDGDVRGLTSVVTLTEVAHRLILLEAIRVFNLPSRIAVRTLKEHPELVRQLSQYKTATEKNPCLQGGNRTLHICAPQDGPEPLNHLWCTHQRFAHCGCDAGTGSH